MLVSLQLCTSTLGYVLELLLSRDSIFTHLTTLLPMFNMFDLIYFDFYVRMKVKVKWQSNSCL